MELGANALKMTSFFHLKQFSFCTLHILFLLSLGWTLQKDKCLKSTFDFEQLKMFILLFFALIKASISATYV